MAPRGKRPGKDETPTLIDAKQRALQEQERKLREKMDRYEKLIEDAPKIAAERAREQREELIRRAARTDKRPISVAALHDRRFTLENVAVPAQQRRMRAERRQGRLTFFVLLLALAGAIFYFYYTVTHG